MPKTKEELNTLKEEIASLSTKLKELSEDELNEVTGGLGSVPLTLAVQLPLINVGFCGSVDNRNDPTSNGNNN